MTMEETEEFFAAYKECALWSSIDERTGLPLDESYGEESLSLQAQSEMAQECEDFVGDNLEDLAGLDAKQAGHDFWLTRNRHGAGFWDRGLGEVGERLAVAARAFGSCTLCVDEDDEIFIQ